MSTNVNTKTATYEQPFFHCITICYLTVPPHSGGLNLRQTSLHEPICIRQNRSARSNLSGLRPTSLHKHGCAQNQINLHSYCQWDCVWHLLLGKWWKSDMIHSHPVWRRFGIVSHQNTYNCPFHLNDKMKPSAWTSHLVLVNIQKGRTRKMSKPMSNLAGYIYPGHVVEFAAVLGILLQHRILIGDIVEGLHSLV